jgi:hypothetical protein
MDRRRLLPPGSIEPCIPTLAAKPPFGPGWVHEIKHDGYGLMVRRDGEAVPQFTATAPLTAVLQAPPRDPNVEDDAELAA